MIPSLFVAHGSPMIAIEDSEYGHFLDGLASRMARPEAIVVFSAHWESPVQMVSDVDEYSTIYDFGGFPDALYRIQYPAKGHHGLSNQIQRLLAEHHIPFQVEHKRGLDHGAWTILHRIYPLADVPVVAMSVNPALTPKEQYDIGSSLSSLREQNVLVIGSGVTFHNFGLIRQRDNPEVKTVVDAFEDWLENNLHAWNLDALFHFDALAPHARIAVPQGGQEHFVPIFYAMGAASDSRTTTTIHRSTLWNVMTNSVYQFG